MAGGVRDTEATFDVAVNGIGKLQELNNAFDKTLSAAKKVDEMLSRGLNMNGGSGSASRFSESISKGASSAEKLNTSLGRAVSLQRDFVTASGRSESSVTKVASAYDKAVISAEKVSQAQSRSAELSARAQTAEARHAEMVAKVATAQSRATEASVKAASAQDRETSALARSVAQADKLASARQKDLALAEKYNAQTNAINNAAARSSMVASGAKRESRVGGAVKEGLAMFGPSMLIAGGVMQGAEYVKELFKQGAEYNSEQSGMLATWKTLVQGARDEGVSKRESGTARGLTSGITSMARDNGRSLDLVNENYQQMYHATESYDRTKHLVQSELRIGDAMGMTDDAAKRFAMYGVGHALDRGKVTGGALNQMVQYAPAITSALARSVVASQKKIGLDKVSEKDVEAEKKNLRDDIKGGDVSAKMLENALNYLGDTKFKEAAKNAMSSIPGMVRSVKNGLPRLVGDFQNGFLTPLGKATSGFFGKMTNWINSDASDKWAKKLGTDLSGVTVKATKFGFEMANGVGKMWKASAPFRSGFADGFVGEMKNIKGAVVDGAKWIGGAYNKLKSIIPKGSDKDLENFGRNVGKVAAFMAALKGASKLPVIGKVFDGMLGKIGGLLGKIPVVGGILQKLIGGGTKNTAAAQMLTASDRMLAAANKMNGGSGGSGGAGGYTNGRVVSGKGKFTLAEKLANSGFGAGIDKMFLKGAGLAGKGGLKGLLGTGLMKGATLFGKGGLGAANILSKIGGSGIGRFLGGAGKLGGSILRRGGGGINALFAGFDVYNAMKNTKAGTNARHAGVGGAIGGGVGGVLGGALGSFLGPVGTVAGDMAGSWLGNKAGKFIGGGWNGFTKDLSKGTKAYQSWSDDLSKKIKATKLPFSSLTAGVMNTVAHPIKSTKKFAKDLIGMFDKVKKFKIGNLFKGFKMPKLTNPFKNKDFLKTLKIRNPFNGWKLPKFKLPKFSLKNPFKGWKMPKFKLTKFKNPFKGWKMPKIKFPKLPKWLSKFGSWFSGAKKAGKATENAGKSTKKASDHIKKAGDNAKKSGNSISSSFGKAFNKVKSGASKFGSTFKKAFNGVSKAGKSEFNKLSSSVKSGLNKAKSSARSGSKGVTNAIKSGLKGVQNVGKNVFNRLPSELRSGLNKAKSTARSGAKGIVTSVRSVLKSMNSAAKSSMNGFSSSIRSAMSKATSAARSGSSKLVSSIKSGLSKVGTAATSSMSKLTTSITSGMSKATSAAKSGADKMATSLSNGFKKAVTAANSATSKIAASMNKIGSSASSATSKVQALANAINSLKSKTVTITANVKGKGADKLEKGTSGALGAFNSIPHYAGGTGTGHAGGMALVNDAKGSNYREAFMLPNGMVGLFPKKRNFMTYLPKGTHVLNANDTRKKFGAGVARYANGTSNALKAVNDMQNRSLSSHSGGKQTKSANVTVNITLNVQNAGAGATDDIMKNLGPAVKAQIEEILRSFNQKESEVIA